MYPTPDNLVFLSDRKPAMAALQPGGYSAEQLIDTMFAFDVSAGEARTIIEAGLALQTTAGAAVLDFARRDS